MAKQLILAIVAVRTFFGGAWDEPGTLEKPMGSGDSRSKRRFAIECFPELDGADPGTIARVETSENLSGFYKMKVPVGTKFVLARRKMEGAQRQRNRTFILSVMPEDFETSGLVGTLSKGESCEVNPFDFPTVELDWETGRNNILSIKDYVSDAVCEGSENPLLDGVSQWVNSFGNFTVTDEEIEAISAGMLGRKVRENMVTACVDALREARQTVA